MYTVHELKAMDELEKKMNVLEQQICTWRSMGFYSLANELIKEQTEINFEHEMICSGITKDIC